MTDKEIFASLSDYEPLEIDWLWDRLIPTSMLTTMEGDPGLGKSFIAMKLAALCSTGGTLPNGQRLPRKGAIYLSTEDDPNFTIRPRIDAMGGDPKLIRVQSKYKPFDDEGLTFLRRELRTHPARLVVIDPLYGFVPSEADMYKPNEIRALLAQLSEIAAEYETALLAIRHVRKGKSDKAIQNGIGSMDVIAVARSALLVAPHPDDPKVSVLAHLKHNLSAKGDSWGYQLITDGDSTVPRLEWTGRVDLTADQLFSSASSPSALDSVIAFLKKELADGPQKASDIQKKANANAYASRTIDRAKKELDLDVKKKGSAWYWSLKGAKNAKDR
jgi:AAA domain